MQANMASKPQNTHLDLLAQYQQKSLDECLLSIQGFELHLKKYEQLRDKLKTLPDELEYEALIPIAESGPGNIEYISGGLVRNAQSQPHHQASPPLAFMMGKIHRTNEVLVHLGDNWFADRSARQALEIVDRRLAKIDLLLTDLNKEKNRTQDWLANVRQVKDEKQQFVEIMEEYDEDKEAQWRQQHRERVRRSKQQEMEAKKRIHFDPSHLPEVDEEDEEKEDEEELAKDLNERKKLSVVQDNPKEFIPKATVQDKVFETKTFDQFQDDQSRQLPSRFAAMATITEHTDETSSTSGQTSNRHMSKFKAERLNRIRK